MMSGGVAGARQPSAARIGIGRAAQSVKLAPSASNAAAVRKRLTALKAAGKH